jgi:hypothetical protein
MTEVIPTDISGIEVKMPSTKKEVANEEILSDRENLSTLLIIKPAPNHNVKKAAKYKTIEIIRKKEL